MSILWPCYLLELMTFKCPWLWRNRQGCFEYFMVWTAITNSGRQQSNSHVIKRIIFTSFSWIRWQRRPCSSIVIKKRRGSRFLLISNIWKTAWWFKLILCVHVISYTYTLKRVPRNPNSIAAWYEVMVFCTLLY